MKKLGLIVNPIAGMGGAVGLKGTDGPGLILRAEELGAVPQAHKRAERAVAALASLGEDLQLFTYGSDMGETAAIAAGLEPLVIGSGSSPRTTSEDTAEAARRIAARRADLLLFAGGDGTARDICAAVGTSLTALGIPAGVKIQSAVFATSPAAAGQVAKSYLAGGIGREKEAEVIDINEDDYRRDVLSTRLYGYLKIPESRRRLQGSKAATTPDERMMQQGIAAEIVEHLEEDRCYLVGPGTTCRYLMELLALDNSLLGVDMIRGRRLIGKDVNEHEILAAMGDTECGLIVTPVGGQGFLLGRGNQQVSPEVIRRVGKQNIIVAATAEKLAALNGRPLLVDTGEAATDAYLSGYYRVVTGYRENTMYRVAC